MHNIEYRAYAENVNRRNVQKELDEYVAAADYAEGCSGLDKPIRWLDAEPVLPDEDAARKRIEELDGKWYDQLAVRFYEPQRGFTDKRMEELKTKEREACDAYHAKDKVWAAGLKAEYIGCKNCGSKLRREHIHTNLCPVCRKDLRPESVLKTVSAAWERWRKAQEKTNAYVRAHAQKTVKWLVKIEYHT